MNAILLTILLLPAVWDQDVLRQALEEARRELDAERKRIREEEEARAKELSELVGTRNRLSDQLVDLRLSVTERERETERLREKRRKLRVEVNRLSADSNEADRILSEARRRLSDLVDVLPPSEGRGDQPERSPDDASVGSFLSRAASLLEEGGSIGRFKSKVLMPGGTAEEAEITRIGHVAWAYRLDGSGRTALAMKAPGTAEGWRWKELAGDTDLRVKSFFDRMASDPAGIAPFPLDVTQGMAVQSRTRRESLEDTLYAGGPVMIPLAGVALLALLLILERFAYFRFRGAGSARFAESVLSQCRGGRFDEARAACNARKSPVARVLGSCLVRREGPARAMEDAIQEAVLHEAPRVERFLPAIGILAAVAPLLGLLGTVTGMILTFDMITVHGTGDPRMMAGGISQALITTATGLVIAIPLLLGHSVLSAKADRLIADMERYAATLLNLLREER